jgi:hypothetical protein
MALRTTYSAETWDKIYQAFGAVSFVSYDFDTIKQSLVDYVRLYYPEYFNDYIQSSELIAYIEIFSYIAEQLAYRVDMVGHENYITTAQRKQSILRLAKLISYKATRNIPVRGLVKLTSITTSERVIDSRGTDLSGLTITWNDANNSNWKEQFFLVMNRVLNSRFGSPQKTFQIGDVVMDLYSLKNEAASFPLGVSPFSVNTGVDNFGMEVVPADLDANGPFEREPDPIASMSIIYANDGVGDGSDYTGFLMYVKQGALSRIDLDITQRLPDRRIDFDPVNVNDTDVWVQRVSNTGSILERWTQVDTIAEQNLVFNDNRATRKKYEVDTLENDRVRVIFGDGDFSDVPEGSFRFWVRQSAGRSLVVQKNKVTNQILGFTYTGSTGNRETCSTTFSLTTTLQNGSAAETIEHIRRSAPATYYAQNRMVNGQDYNTFMLKNPTILRLKAINRTFAGQPKYIDWNDASGMYENVKLFGDDLIMRYELGINTQTTAVSGQALIDSVIEPLLSTSGVINTLVHLSATDPVTRGVVSPPRRRFIEDNRGALYRAADNSYVKISGTGSPGDGSLKEKTAIQGVIDRHYYGEPLKYVLDASNTVLAQIPDPDIYVKDDSRIYAANVPRTIDGVNRFPPGDIGSGLQPQSDQDFFALRYNRYTRRIGTGSITINLASDQLPPGYWIAGEVFTIEVQADGVGLAVRSNLRGTLSSGEVGLAYLFEPVGQSTPVTFFTVTAQTGGTAFEPGDAFILDTSASGIVSERVVTGGINLNGWWEIIGLPDLPSYTAGMVADSIYTNSNDLGTAGQPLTNLKQHSWVIFIRKIKSVNTVIGYEVHTRDLKLAIESPTTKFWYNSVDQLIDSQTKKRVFDNVKVLRSNKNSSGAILGTSQTYDVVGAVRDADGIVDLHKLEIAPTDMLNESSSGDLIPDRLLQFETFAAGSYEYFLVAAPTAALVPGTSAYIAAVDAFTVAETNLHQYGTFVAGSTLQYGRRQRMPATPVSTTSETGLDFMWQHFSPFTNIIDPSVTNIHDLYVMTRGYYDGVISYVRGVTDTAPTPPTPLELRNAYGSLLNNKMLSDTVVLHSGRIKLLFGPLAEPQLRAKFKVVRQLGASLTNERIKEEILNVINTYFDIDGWDFGDSFYATELITLIHQRLPSDVASVVLVPVYSTNSFGSMFTVESGHDQILQSACELTDIQVVDALTPTVIRQVK